MELLRPQARIVIHFEQREQGYRLDSEPQGAMARGRPVCISSRWCRASGGGTIQRLLRRYGTMGGPQARIHVGHTYTHIWACSQTNLRAWNIFSRVYDCTSFAEYYQFFARFKDIGKRTLLPPRAQTRWNPGYSIQKGYAYTSPATQGVRSAGLSWSGRLVYRESRKHNVIEILAFCVACQSMDHSVGNVHSKYRHWGSSNIPVLDVTLPGKPHPEQRASSPPLLFPSGMTSQHPESCRRDRVLELLADPMQGSALSQACIDVEHRLITFSGRKETGKHLKLRQR